MQLRFHGRVGSHTGGACTHTSWQQQHNLTSLTSPAQSSSPAMFPGQLVTRRAVCSVQRPCCSLTLTAPPLATTGQPRQRATTIHSRRAIQNSPRCITHFRCLLPLLPNEHKLHSKRCSAFSLSTGPAQSVVDSWAGATAWCWEALAHFAFLCYFHSSYFFDP
jgi:hypothetical protein